MSQPIQSSNPPLIILIKMPALIKVSVQKYSVLNERAAARKDCSGLPPQKLCKSHLFIDRKEIVDQGICYIERTHEVKGGSKKTVILDSHSNLS